MKKSAYLVETPASIPAIAESCSCAGECENCCGGQHKTGVGGSDDTKQRAFLVRFMEAKKSGDEGRAKAIAQEAEKHGIDME